MTLEQTTARLIATAIGDFVKEDDFGILARNLPLFDPHTLCEALDPESRGLRLALIGFKDAHLPDHIAVTVEDAIVWRNDSDISIPLVVILSMQASYEQDKIHSLEFLKPFTDRDLWYAICRRGEEEADDETPRKWLWHVLKSDFVSLVATQGAALYHTLQQQELARALPCIGLLPDPELDDIDSQKSLKRRLSENWENVCWLSELDNRAHRALARALPSRALRQQHSQTFRQIKEYARNPSVEILQKLTLDAVITIRTAQKASEESLVTTVVPAPSRATRLTSAQFLVTELLQLDPDKGEDQQRTDELRCQAQRISEMFYEELSNDYRSDLSTEKLVEDKTEENYYEVLIDRHGDEITTIKYPGSDAEHPLHPLHDLMSEWVHPYCWGGNISILQVPGDSLEVNDLFDGSIELPFTPFQPIDPSTELEKPSNNLLTLFTKLDEQISESPQDNLADILLELHKHRTKLTYYHKQFMYYPNWALHNSILKPIVEAYLAAYEKLAHRLRQVYMIAKADFSDTVEQAAAQFLALDAVIIEFPHRGKGRSEAVVLTTLHPLHLWKWLELAKLIQNNRQELSSGELHAVSEAAKSLPVLLNTFFLHTRMFARLHHLDEPRLVLAGEISSARSELTVGIPFYEPVTRQSPTADGLKEFADLFDRFLTLYPPARLGLVIALVDPPEILPVLEKLGQLHSDGILNSARVHVYHTNTHAAAYDDWRDRENEVLQLFREKLHWVLTVSLEYSSYVEIKKELVNKRPHLILICDPSESVAQPVFRTLQEQASPFGVPVQLSYDSISDTARLVPIPSGSIFDAYAGVRNALTGELQKSSIGVGNRRTIDLDDLRALIDPDEGSNWLIIVDRPHGNLELPSNIGRRLAWYPVGSRTLAIHTNKRDWEQYWLEKLDGKMSALELPRKITITYILEHLLELFPILPQGLIALINKLNGNRDLNDIFSGSALSRLLGIVIVLNWYRQHKPNPILIPINTDDFADWYRESRPTRLEESESRVAAFWLEGSTLYADIVALHVIPDTFDMLPDLARARVPLGQLVKFALTLESLFAESANIAILTPLRRSLLRDRLGAAVFAAPNNAKEGVLRQNREGKAIWASAINGLFADYVPKIRLLDIRVALRETAGLIDEQYYYGDDGYRQGIIKLPGAFLQSETIPKVSHTVTDVTTAPEARDEYTEPTGLVVDQPKHTVPTSQHLIQQQTEQLRQVLIAYGIPIAGINTDKTQVGPRFIRFWVKLQPPTGRLSELQKYAVDIARELECRSVPFIDNIPGERYVGIDLPRERFESIPLAPALADLPSNQPNGLLIAMGKNPAGDNVVRDLVRLPHLLVAGSTGSGKTVFLSCLITSLVWRHTPKEVEFLLIDPKQMDFLTFEGVPHLRGGQILYEPSQSIAALHKLTSDERTRRTNLLRQARCPNILEYNRRNPSKRLPWIVVVIDEFADIVLTLSRKEREEFERQVNRLAATGRAIGIHLVLATQRPTTDVVTGTIKANIPARVSFRLPSVTDSRTILDRSGAENLLGQGDMLMSFSGILERFQGYYVSHDELMALLSKLVG